MRKSNTVAASQSVASAQVAAVAAPFDAIVAAAPAVKKPRAPRKPKAAANVVAMPVPTVIAPVAPVIDQKLVVLSGSFVAKQRILYKAYNAKKPMSPDNIAKLAANVKRVEALILEGKCPTMVWPTDKLDSFSEVIVCLAADSYKGVRRQRYGVKK